MNIEVTVDSETEIEVDGIDSDAEVTVHFGDQDLKVEGEITATVTLNRHFTHEVDADEVQLPGDVIQTCQALELDSVFTLQSLFDALEQMEKDMHFEEGTQCKK